MDFKERLKEQRNFNQLTQKAVAQRLGISPSCYAGYESGYREPDLNMLKKICKLLKVSSDYLLGLEDETSAKNY